MESTGSGLAPVRVPPIEPAPSRIVVRPFDKLSAGSKLVLPDNIATGRNTTGIVVKTHRGTQSVMVDTDDLDLDAAPWILVGDQVVFSAMSGTEIVMPEPQPDNKRHTQTYIVLRESDVIAIIRDDSVPMNEVTAEPRSYA